MTNKELVETYLAYHGMKRVEGKDEDLSPLLPFIMMDITLDMYLKVIKPLNCKHLMNHYRKEWKRNYDAFNARLFMCFNADQRDALTDKMDEFEEYIQNYVMIAKVQIMNCISFEPIERQEVLATCLLCSILAQSARIIWGRIYKNDRLEDGENIYLRSIELYIKKFMDAYYGVGKPRVKCDDNEAVRNAVDILCKKTIQWLYK